MRMTPVRILLTLSSILAALGAVSCSGDYDNTPVIVVADDDSAADDDTTPADDDVWTDDDDTWTDDDTWMDDDTWTDDDVEPYEDFNALFIDVGLGDSTLLAIPDGEEMRYMLVDGGSVGEGTYTVCPILDAHGIDTLDVMVETHPHFDHCGGLSEIFACVTVLEVWENGDVLPDDEGYQAYSAARDAWGGLVVTPAIGETKTVGEASFYILSSLASWEIVNDNSMAMLMSYADRVFLFGADAQENSQNWMALQYGATLASDVVRVPCHGAYGTNDFITAVNAPYGVISVGPNDLGYPHQDTLDEYADVGTELFSTEDVGSVNASLDQDGALVIGPLSE